MRRTIKNRVLAFLASFFVISLILCVADFFFFPVSFSNVFLILIFLGLIYICSLYEGQFYIKAIVIGTCVSSSLLLRVLNEAVLASYLKNYRIFSWEVAASSTVLLLLLCLFFFRFTVVTKTTLPKHYGISMAVFITVMGFLTDTVRLASLRFDERLLRIGVCAIPVVTILYLYYLFFRIVHEFEEKRTYELTVQQMELQKKHLQQSELAQRELRNLRHEIKNHVFYMQTLLKQNKLDELEDFFSQVYRSEYGIDMLDSGNSAVDVLLNQKAAYAKSKTIQTTMQVALPEVIPVDESELCSVISNLFDNAVEACESLPAPAISLAVSQTGSYIHIICKNTAPFDVCKNNPLLETTKSYGNHGIGLQVVQKIIEKYDGMMEYHMENMVFVITVMLRIDAEKQ